MLRSLATAAVLCLSADLVSAATFRVDTTLDARDIVPGDGVCATSAGRCSLRAAIQEANNSLGPTVVMLPAGTYALTLGAINLVDSVVTITGASAMTTIIDAQFFSQVFTVIRAELNLSDVTVQNGDASGTAGGCVSAQGFGVGRTQVTLVRSVVKGCRAVYGGAISVRGTATDGAGLLMSDTTVSHNVSTLDGGGIFIGPNVFASLVSVAVVDNVAGGCGGGFFAGGSAVFIAFTAISGNRAEVGGGGYCTGPGVGFMSLVTTISGSTIASNVSTGGGGGLRLDTGFVDISGSTISGNSAPSGGGIDARTSVRLGNTTISGNVATTGDGGALTFVPTSTSRELTLRNVTMASNQSATGAAMVVSTDQPALVSVKNTIVANNGGAAPSNCLLSGVVDNLGNNLEYPGTTCAFAQASDWRADPRLAPLAFNGGLTQTHALEIGSAAIDTGDDVWCDTYPVSGFDQRGVRRPAGRQCDIGAYESAFTSPRRASGDFDDDRKTDLVVYRPSTGTWWIKGSAGGSRTYHWGVDTDVPVPADYDGDGLTDPAVYRPSTGLWYILLSRTEYSSFVTHHWGTSTDVAVPGDYDGDGKSDPAVYRPSTGTWFILQSSTDYATYVLIEWGLGTDLAVPQDYDGDGRTDIAVYRPSNAIWYVLQSTTNYTTFTADAWGLGGDVPVPADYDGDHKADRAVYRPSAGTWFVLQSSSNNTQFVSQDLGLAGDIPVPGDHDGDGKPDLVVFRPSNGTWHILTSSSNYTRETVDQWGISTDIPALTRR